MKKEKKGLQDLGSEKMYLVVECKLYHGILYWDSTVHCVYIKLNNLEEKKKGWSFEYDEINQAWWNKIFNVNVQEDLHITSWTHN